jgi:predicted MPP superfamily phosphohydrolase
VGAIGLITADMFIETERLETTLRRIKLQESQSPSAIRMVQVSDLHTRGFSAHEHKIVRAIEEAKPDLIAITGDAVDARRYLGALDEFLTALPPGIPKIAITGNWEYWAEIDMAAFRRQYERHDCRLMIDESMTIELRGKGLRIIGIQDLVGGRPDLNKAFSNLPDADTEIILAHCPGHRDVITTRKAVMISGHTHGGQLALPGYVPFIPLGSGSYKRGWYETPSGPLYVSRGLGTSRVHVRFNSVPELAILELTL